MASRLKVGTKVSFQQRHHFPSSEHRETTINGIIGFVESPGNYVVIAGDGQRHEVTRRDLKLR